MKEVSYIQGEEQAAGELKHGPFTLFSKDVTVVATVFPSAKNYLVTMSNLKEIKAWESPPILVGTRGDREGEELTVE